MRGKDTPVFITDTCFGITPAHAGKRQYMPQKSRHVKDHPRTCGEKDAEPIGPKNLTGSPPHMRGKGAMTRWSAVKSRITPAHAGKSYYLT